MYQSNKTNLKRCYRPKVFNYSKYYLNSIDIKTKHNKKKIKQNQIYKAVCNRMEMTPWAFLLVFGSFLVLTSGQTGIFWRISTTLWTKCMLTLLFSLICWTEKGVCVSLNCEHVNILWNLFYNSYTKLRFVRNDHRCTFWSLHLLNGDNDDDDDSMPIFHLLYLILKVFFFLI